MKHRLLAFILSVSGSVVLRRDQRICISNSFSGDINADVWDTFCKLLNLYSITIYKIRIFFFILMTRHYSDLCHIMHYDFISFIVQHFLIPGVNIFSILLSPNFPID